MKQATIREDSGGQYDGFSKHPFGQWRRTLGVWPNVAAIDFNSSFSSAPPPLLTSNKKASDPMRTFANLISAVAVCLIPGGLVSPVYAQGPWSALPGSCASTDNNFYNGTPSNDYPVARFRVPGGSLAFNGFHDGYIAVICTVDNPRVAATVTNRWNQLQVTYRDPDGMGLPGQKGSEYQAYVELVRVSKTTGTWGRITSFDSNLQCAGGPSLCQADNTTKTFTVTFSHTFDFDNYAYAVYGRLYRALATFSLTPVIYQLRLQGAPAVVQPGQVSETVVQPGPALEFGPAALQDDRR
jgi:hypothetical protein